MTPHQSTPPPPQVPAAPKPMQIKQGLFQRRLRVRRCCLQSAFPSSEHSIMTDLAALQERFEPLFPGLLGMKLDEVTRERVVGSLVVRPNLCTTGNTLHGGVYMAFADTLGAVATFVNLPPGARTVTIESKTNFLGGAPVGAKIIGESIAFHKGKNTQVWQTQIRREDGKLCAVVTQTQMVIAG
jgi:1,4-dihydroxy-2-naphthoyl-CoA hydrolase